MECNFLWGGSTSAFQYEGGGKEGGKGLSIYDIREQRKGVKYSETSEFYYHFMEDIALMAEMGFKAFRMSISWTRIYPNGTEKEPNKEGIKFYIKVFQELKKYNIEPVVTLFHWDMPQELVEKYNGFKDKGFIEHFERYCRTCYEEFGAYVKYWLTLNENNLGLLIPNMFLDEKVSPEDDQFEQIKWDIYINSLICHFKAVQLGHELVPNSQIGCMLASAFAYPLTSDPVDVLEAQKHNRETMWNDLDILTTGKIDETLCTRLSERKVNIKLSKAEKELMKDPNTKIDFISFSYYFSICMQDRDPKKVKEAETVQLLYQAYHNPYLPKTSFGWQIDPLGLRIFMNELYDRYKLPLMIVENGCGVETDQLTEDKKVHDDYRIEYLEKHIKQVLLTVEEDHIPVLGYLPWGCIDLYSASGNRNKRYGFVYVDYDNQFKRYKKDSFYWYKEVINSNGLNVKGDMK